MNKALYILLFFFKIFVIVNYSRDIFIFQSYVVTQTYITYFNIGMHILKRCTYEKTMSDKTNMECEHCKPQRKATYVTS